MIDLRPLGDRAFLARFADERSAQGWAEAVRARALPGVVEVTVAYGSAAAFADPDLADLADLERLLRSIEPTGLGRPTGRTILVPVLYDGEDLPEVARLVGLAEPEVVARHAGTEYTVFALGFLPGFPYAGYLAEPLAGLPRRKRPRAVVPAGSVAIAGRQTGIYPTESPGGWRLLGRTPLKVVDLVSGHFPIRAGDHLRFHSIGPDEYRARLGEPLGPTGLVE